tara:strand:- start:149 stop:382 length:234 start_codon:yes stop_codon:yes gene_type:complete
MLNSTMDKYIQERNKRIAESVNKIGIDPSRWVVINDGHHPTAAIYFNGTAGSLSQDEYEEIRKAITNVLQQRSEASE